MEIKILKVKLIGERDKQTAIDMQKQIKKKLNKSIKMKVLRKVKRNIMPDVYCEIYDDIMYIFPDILRDITQAKAFVNLAMINFWNTTLIKQLVKFYKKKVFPESKVSISKYDDYIKLWGAKGNDNN